MPNTESFHHRKPTRLKEYDYSFAGTYFVTLCTVDQKRHFGEISDGRMVLNRAGEIIQQSWEGLTRHYENVTLDVFIVMPNHFHGIIILTDDARPSRAGLKPAPTKKRPGLGEIVRGFKTFSTRKFNSEWGTPGIKLWQRNYFDRVRKYILDNPIQWEIDHDNPNVKTKKPVPDPWDEL